MTTGTTTSELTTTSSSEEAVEDGATTTVAFTALAQNATNKYTFGEGDCTVVADGEFYCVTEGPQTHKIGDPRVYAEKDREGDREVFYFDGVEIRRITNNSYDDFAPAFDEKTKRIVWQAMINDRLQVMFYDIPTNTTRQVTTSRQNSSNPHIAGGTVVWQEWVGTNWEIMMTDVGAVGDAFALEQLTDNAVHDMFPRAYNDLITWQSEKGASWEVIVYDLRTGEKHALQKDEATKYENPRFVLLFDSRHDNGDVETIGYDLDTGEMMELGTKAKPIPADPVTPDDETPDAIPRTATSTAQVKVSGREDDTDTGSSTEPVIL
jgi:beta propeller repeat protein